MASLRQRASGVRTQSRAPATMIVVGTGPECIELAPVVHALAARA